MALHVFVIKETELEDPQDLRAESGKCPNSTNERKNMSTKTLRKRIALVAVSALGAGLLSVVPVSSANAGAGDIASITGIGLLASDSVTSVTGTATLLSTGSLTVTENDNAGYFVVSGPAYISTATTIASISGDQKKYTPDGNDTFTVVPTGAAGTTFTVTGYTTPTSGVVVDVLTVTIAGTSVAGVVSPADSTVTWVATDGATSATDVSGANATTYGLGLFANVQLKDAYAAEITKAGALVATVTGDATVAIGAVTGSSTSATGDAVSTAGTFTQAVSGLNPSDINILIKEKTAGTGWKGTLTVTYNGVVVATKTGTITGAPAKITVTPKKIGTTAGGANEDSFTFVVNDAAGNLLDFTATNYVLNKSSNTAIVSDAAGTENGTASSATPANGDHTCAGTAGSADVSIKTTINGTVLVSNTVKLSCGGAAVSYGASFDKASYVQGEIATMTVTFKDVDGNIAHSYSTVTTADGDTTISAPMMVRVGGDTILAATKPGGSGTIAHTFTVGTNTGLTEGSYNAVVNYSKTLTLASPATVAYKVTTGSTGVSNADVLKAIVSLIASINKQIAALQKALLKR
jgi:trimeric autotransporter adhesin